MKRPSHNSPLALRRSWTWPCKRASSARTCRRQTWLGDGNWQHAQVQPSSSPIENVLEEQRCSILYHFVPSTKSFGEGSRIPEACAPCMPQEHTIYSLHTWFSAKCRQARALGVGVPAASQNLRPGRSKFLSLRH